MAKEVHGYIKTLLIVGTIVFACGGYAMRVNGNTKAIALAVEADVKTNDRVDAVEDMVVELRISDVKQTATAEATLNALVGIHQELKALSQIKQDMAVMKVQVKTLIPAPKGDN
jgi:hypothetical protein